MSLTIRTHVGLLAVAALAIACNSEGRLVDPSAPALVAARAGVPFTKGLASPEWQGTAASLVAQAGFNPITGRRAISSPF